MDLRFFLRLRSDQRRLSQLKPPALQRIVVATANPGKLAEISALLAPRGVEVLPASAWGAEVVPEPHATFIENALAKARHVAAATGLPALADDSGLCVGVLGGAPGARSARFVGEAATDGDNNRKLLEALQGETRRGAYYYCVMVLLSSPDDPRPLVAEGEWGGEIGLAPRGTGGFGYDPLFVVPALGKTAAELAPEKKNRLSHRGQALRRLLEQLEARWSLP